jgi:hypothetical protein
LTLIEMSVLFRDMLQMIRPKNVKPFIMNPWQLKKWSALLLAWTSLQGRPLVADQTDPGDLTVTGIEDIQGNILKLGTRTDNSNPGWLTLYTDGTTSTLEFDASRSANNWEWQQNGGSTLQLQMSLSSTNALVLYDQSATPTAKITLNPLGTSTFSNSLLLNGTDNEMPNQTVVNSSSVLTKGMADSLYLSPDTYGYVGIGVANPTSTLQVEGSLRLGDGSQPYAPSEGYGIISSAGSDNAGLTISQSSTSAYTSIDLLTQDSISSGWSVQIQPNNPGLAFFDRTASVNAVYIQQGSDNVGIGTSTPTALLEVSGNAKVDGALVTSGNATVQGNLNVTGSIVVTPSGDIPMYTGN